MAIMTLNGVARPASLGRTAPVAGTELFALLIAMITSAATQHPHIHSPVTQLSCRGSKQRINAYERIRNHHDSSRLLPFHCLLGRIMPKNSGAMQHCSQMHAIAVCVTVQSCCAACVLVGKGMLWGTSSWLWNQILIGFRSMLVAMCLQVPGLLPSGLFQSGASRTGHRPLLRPCTAGGAPALLPRPQRPQLLLVEMIRSVLPIQVTL